MTDHNFLKFFIEEDVYVLKGESPELVDTPTILDEPERIPENVVEETQKMEKTPEIPSLKEDISIPESPKEPSYTPPVFSGMFAKKVMIVVHTEGLKFPHQDFMYKVLSSIKLQKEDIAVVPSGHIKSKEDFEWMTSDENKLFIAFGLPDKWMERIHTSPDKYKILEGKTHKLLFSDSLENLNNDQQLKLKLWEQLKVLGNEF